MVTENTTPNRGYQEPAVGNTLKVDIGRLVSALRAIDVDVANALAAIVSKAGLASPAFTGTPTAPTAAPGTDTGQLATTAFVKAAVNALVDSAPGALDTLNELAAAIGDDPNFAATMAALIGTKADAAATTAALALKADDAATTAALALKADAATTNTHALTAKTTPVDADEMRIADSAASFGFKKLTFANLKAWITGVVANFGRRRLATITLSAAAHDITGIPAGVKCITLTYDITQTSAGSLTTFQLGTAGGIQTSSYDSTSETSPGSTSPTTNTVTGGFNLLSSGLSAVIFGKMTIERIGTTNQWIATAQHRYSTSAMAREVGKVTLSGELTQLRMSVSGGTLTGSLDVTVEYG